MLGRLAFSISIGSTLVSLLRGPWAVLTGDWEIDWEIEATLEIGFNVDDAEFARDRRSSPIVSSSTYATSDERDECLDRHLADMVEMRVPIRDSPLEDILEDKLPDRRLFVGDWAISRYLSVRSYPSESRVDEYVSSWYVSVG